MKREGLSTYQAAGDQWLTLGSLTVHKVEAIEGETVWRLEGEHGFHVCPPMETLTAAAVDAYPFKDVRWRPKSVGYLPPGLTLNGVALTKANITFVRMPDRIFQQAVSGSVCPKSLDFRWLADVDDPVAASLIETIDRASQEVDLDRWPLLAESIGMALATRILQHLGAKPKTEPEGNLDARVHRVREYVEEHLTEPLGLEELANVAAMSPFHFARSFRRAVGVTPVRYVWQRRLERAKQALRDPRMSLAAIAAMCGFSSQSHFSAAFKTATGMTPKRFRDSILGALLAMLGWRWLGLAQLAAGVLA